MLLASATFVLVLLADPVLIPAAETDNSHDPEWWDKRQDNMGEDKFWQWYWRKQDQQDDKDRKDWEHSLEHPKNPMRSHRHFRLQGRTFVVKSESCGYCPATELYEFEMRFEETPDFWTNDEHYRTANSFQFFVWHDDVPFSYQGFDVMIWSSEIETVGEVVVREHFRVDPPGLGGWGPVRGSVAYLLKNKSISFSIPADMIGDFDGHIHYQWHTCIYGVSAYQYRHNKIDDHIVLENESTIQPGCKNKNAASGSQSSRARTTTWGAVKEVYRSQAR